MSIKDFIKEAEKLGEMFCNAYTYPINQIEREEHIEDQTFFIIKKSKWESLKQKLL